MPKGKPFEPAITFGDRVRRRREELDIAQERFAHSIGMDRSYFSSVERGERNVALVNICRIAAGLGVNPAELVDGITLPDDAAVSLGR